MRVKKPKSNQSKSRLAYIAVSAAAVASLVVGGVFVANRLGSDEVQEVAGTSQDGGQSDSELEPAAEQETPAPAPDEPGAEVGTYKLQTSEVSLVAESILIEAAGKEFVVPTDVEVVSDPGDLEYKSLEIGSWEDHETEMRLYFYLEADGSDWWVTEIRTYDGLEVADEESTVEEPSRLDDQTYFYPQGKSLGAKIGESYQGDLVVDLGYYTSQSDELGGPVPSSDLIETEDGSPAPDSTKIAKLTIKGLELSVPGFG